MLGREQGPTEYMSTNDVYKSSTVIFLSVLSHPPPEVQSIARAPSHAGMTCALRKLRLSNSELRMRRKLPPSPRERKLPMKLPSSLLSSLTSSLASSRIEDDWRIETDIRRTDD